MRRVWPGYVAACAAGLCFPWLEPPECGWMGGGRGKAAAAACGTGLNSARVMWAAVVGRPGYLSPLASGGRANRGEPTGPTC